MSLFIVKQLPVLPPETYLEDALPGVKYAELVVPRALELTYTSWELQPFAADLGYEGEPFAWDDERRHKLQCELDAVFAHMYGLERAELEWGAGRAAAQRVVPRPKAQRNSAVRRVSHAALCAGGV